jgi:hypothetical protein
MGRLLSRTGAQETSEPAATALTDPRPHRAHSVQHRQEAFIGNGLAGTLDCLRFHWPEYLMEAAEVAIYLFLTCIFAKPGRARMTLIRPCQLHFTAQSST